MLFLPLKSQILNFKKFKNETYACKQVTKIWNRVLDALKNNQMKNMLKADDEFLSINHGVV